MSVDNCPTCPDCGDDLVYMPDKYIPQVLGWRYYWGKPEGTIGDWTCTNCPEKKWFDIPEGPLPEPEPE